MIYIPTRGPARRRKPNVARHHDRGFIKSIEHHEGCGQEPSESVIDVKRQWPKYIPGGRDGEKTLYVPLLGTSWSLFPLAPFEEATKTSRLLGDGNKSKVVDRVI